MDDCRGRLTPFIAVAACELYQYFDARSYVTTMWLTALQSQKRDLHDDVAKSCRQLLHFGLSLRIFW